MSTCVVAYVPVLHEGYWRFFDAHARERPLHVVGRELYADYRPLAKDVRALAPELVAVAVRAWGVCSDVSVLDADGARTLAATRPRIVLPAEDVSYQLVERHFPRCEVRYDSVFLRWDKTRSVQLLRPEPATRASVDDAVADLRGPAKRSAGTSVDWWRRVGAAMRLPDGQVWSTANEHLPHPLSHYAVGDPRSNLNQGVGYELSTAVHAEARLIARAAREGVSTADAVLYTTDFPCPPCAKLIASAGVRRLYFEGGYAVLDGEEVLEAAGVEIVQVGMP